VCDVIWAQSGHGIQDGRCPLSLTLTTKLSLAKFLRALHRHHYTAKRETSTASAYLLQFCIAFVPGSLEQAHSLAHRAGMLIRLPLTIEVLGLKEGNLVVLDRVIGATVHVNEAKRIGRRLLAIVDTEIRPEGFRILSDDHEMIYVWQVPPRD
jgi:hypothetical protein